MATKATGLLGSGAGDERILSSLGGRRGLAATTLATVSSALATQTYVVHAAAPAGARPRPMPATARRLSVHVKYAVAPSAPSASHPNNRV